jgi:hypothetical protein
MRKCKQPDPAAESTNAAQNGAFAMAEAVQRLPMIEIVGFSIGDGRVT